MMMNPILWRQLQKFWENESEWWDKTMEEIRKEEGTSLQEKETLKEACEGTVSENRTEMEDGAVHILSKNDLIKGILLGIAVSLGCMGLLGLIFLGFCKVFEVFGTPIGIAVVALFFLYCILAVKYDDYLNKKNKKAVEDSETMETQSTMEHK